MDEKRAVGKMGLSGNTHVDNRGPVEVPFEGNLDLDSFLDSLPGHLRMKVVQQISGEPRTRPQGAKGAEATASQTALGRSWTWEKVLLVGLVAPVLLTLALTVLAGRLAENIMKSLIQYTKEKINEA